MANFVIPNIWFTFQGLSKDHEKLSVEKSQMSLSNGQCHVITFTLQNITGIKLLDDFERRFSPQTETKEVISDCSNPPAPIRTSNTHLTFEEYQNFLEEHFIPRFEANTSSLLGLTLSDDTHSLASRNSKSSQDENVAHKADKNRSENHDILLKEKSGSVSSNSSAASLNQTRDTQLSTKSSRQDSSQSSQPGRNSQAQKSLSWKPLEDICWTVFHQKSLSSIDKSYSAVAKLFWQLFKQLAYRQPHAAYRALYPSYWVPVKAGHPQSTEKLEEGTEMALFTNQIHIPVVMEARELDFWLGQLGILSGTGVYIAPTAGSGHHLILVDFQTAWKRLMEAVQEHQLTCAEVLRVLRKLTRRVVKKIYRKDLLMVDNKGRGFQLRNARKCVLYYDRLRVKQHDKDGPNQEIFLHKVEIAQVSDKQFSLKAGDTTTIFEAETDRLCSKWVAGVNRLVKIGNRHRTNSELSLEDEQFMIRSIERHRFRVHESQKISQQEKEQLSHIKATEELRLTVENLQKNCQDITQEKDGAINELHGAVMEMENSMKKKEEEMAVLIADLNVKQAESQHLQEQYEVLLQEQAASTAEIQLKSSELRAVIEQRDQLDRQLASLHQQKSSDSVQMAEIREQLEQALLAEKSRRDQEQRSRLEIERLLEVEKSRREEKLHLLEDEVNERKQLEESLRAEREKVLRILKEKEELRAKQLQMREELRIRQQLMKKLNISLEVESHRGPGSFQGPVNISVDQHLLDNDGEEMHVN